LWYNKSIIKEGDKTVPFVYKINILDALKDRGIKTTTIRNNKLFSESTLQKFRKQLPVSWENLEMLCKLLNCQPGDIIEYVEENRT
jgi:putative transcriptional regulator